MSWFSKKKDVFTDPKEMTPLESVTHLCAVIQLADGEADYEERKAWLNALSELFPEFSEERADKFLFEAQKQLSLITTDETRIYLIKILHRIKTVLENEKIIKLGPKLSQLIEADGIVMTAETEIAKLIEEKLGISISLNEKL